MCGTDGNGNTSGLSIFSKEAQPHSSPSPNPPSIAHLDFLPVLTPLEWFGSILPTTHPHPHAIPSLCNPPLGRGGGRGVSLEPFPCLFCTVHKARQGRTGNMTPPRGRRGAAILDHWGHDPPGDLGPRWVDHRSLGDRSKEGLGSGVGQTNRNGPPIAHTRRLFLHSKLSSG